MLPLGPSLPVLRPNTQHIKEGFSTDDRNTITMDYRNLTFLACALAEAAPSQDSPVGKETITIARTRSGRVSWNNLQFNQFSYARPSGDILYMSPSRFLSSASLTR